MKSSTDRCCRRREQSNYKCPAVGCSRSRCKAPLYRSRSVLRLGKIGPAPDRKSTRLNSSHLVISYAVFCLKKKKLRNLAISGGGRRTQQRVILHRSHWSFLRLSYLSHGAWRLCHIRSPCTRMSGLPLNARVI